MQTDYDIAIIGGGLAGLSASIQLAQKGHQVILFEKEAFPFHKVCGEYISLESKGFLQSLGVPLNDWKVPIIDTLILTAPNGKSHTTKLPLGGFGVSRYLLDSCLANIAQTAGITLLDKTKVEDVTKTGEGFLIRFGGKTITAKICCAAFGKRSNLDVKWGRDFISKQDERLNNYVGVKYHVRTDWKPNLIGLHNFKNGYCGISKIENDRYCLCYMTKASNLKENANNIEQMQQEVLFQNTHLKSIFTNSEKVQDFPVTISQISFSQKSKSENGLLMLGDAAGMITPLCGNGMSIALHTSKIAATLFDQYLQHNLSYEQVLNEYEQQWRLHFGKRLKAGRMLQAFFGSTLLSNVLVATIKALPFLTSPLIRQTHGKPF